MLASAFPYLAIHSSRLQLDPPLAPLPRTNNLELFVGEESALPTPPAGARNPTASPFADFGIPASSYPDPSIWSEEQQTRLLNALMAGAQSRSGTQTPQPPSAIESSADSNATNGTMPEGDPFAALMAMMGQQGPPGEKDGGGGGPGPIDLGMLQQNLFNPPTPPVPVRRSLLQKIMPVVHLLAGWLLLAYFVIWKEPVAYDAKQRAADVVESRWKRWAELGWQSPQDGWGVQFVVS